MDDVTGQVFLVGAEFLAEMRLLFEGEKNEMSGAVPTMQRAPLYLELEDVLMAVANEFGLKSTELSQPWRRGDERAVAI